MTPDSVAPPAPQQMDSEVMALAVECGGVVYRNRANAQQPAIAFGDESWQRFAGVLSARKAKAAQLGEALIDYDHLLSQWARAYPEAVFPEPDLSAARAALEAAGMTLDSVSAAGMRHVATKLAELFGPVRQFLTAAQPDIDHTSSGEHSGAATQREQSMAMMIRMLCSHTANAGTRQRAMALLREYGLQGSPLRTGQQLG